MRLTGRMMKAGLSDSCHGLERLVWNSKSGPKGGGPEYLSVIVQLGGYSSVLLLIKMNGRSSGVDSAQLGFLTDCLHNY